MNCKYNVFPKLSECRKRLFMSQRELAEAAGISVETYKKHERGEFDFRLSEMLAIQEMLNDALQCDYTLDELFQMSKIV